MVTEQAEQKITYTTMSVGQVDAFNRAYDEALARVMNELGNDYPIHIGGQPRRLERDLFEDRSPNDTRILLGRFQCAEESEVDDAAKAAAGAFYGWSRTPWPERVRIMRRAAENFRRRKYEIAAWLTLEAGKARLESMGEVEEAADLIDTYADQMEEHQGFVIKLKQLTDEEVNHSILRPYGVWAVISPFNFPVALATGMLAGALTAGNTVIFKPSHWTPLTGVKVYECLADAGLPDGVLNLLTGTSRTLNESLTGHKSIEGVAFIGSREVGCHIYSKVSSDRPRPCIAEMGGKNPVIVTEHADLKKAVEGTARAAFGYSGQKCSAASRVYVHDQISDEFIARLVERTNEIVVGNPVRPDVFMGPVINEPAYNKFKEACDVAQREGRVLAGGHVLTEGHLEHGYYCAPTVAEFEKHHRFFAEELFLPFLVVTTAGSLDEAIDLANESEYGLTAGIFTEDADEIREFLDRIEAGVVYVNREGGATTGAWPGVQSFGGWKASGSTGKSALGPYYVQQFMHEQSQTVVS